MIHPADKVLPVALSVSLFASCFPSCYTLAYADDLTDGSATNVSAEKQKEIAGDPSGFELAPGGGESDAYAADGGAATEGYGPDVETTEGAIEDTTSGYGEVDSFVGSDVSTFGNDFGGSGFAADGNEDSSQFGVSSSNGDSSGIEEDSYSNGEKGVLEYLEDIVYLLGEIADYYRQGGSGISPLADINSVYDQLVYIKTEIGSLNAVALGSAAASNRIGWTIAGSTFNTSRGGLPWLISALYYTMNDRLSKIQTYNSSIPSLLSDLQKQWGTGYGGTVVTYKDSPAANLKSLLTESYFISAIKGRLESQWGYGYGGTVVTYNGSPADNLKHLLSESYFISAIKGRIEGQWGYGYGDSAVIAKDSPAYNLKHLLTESYFISAIKGRIEDQWGYGFGGDVSYKAGSPYDLLYRIQRNSDYITSIDYWSSQLYDLLGKIQRNSDYVTSIDNRIESYFLAHSNLVSKGFSDVLSSLDLLSSKDADLSETNKLLGRLTADVSSIRDKFVLQDSLSDLLDFLVGDMQVPQTQAAISRIQDVMSTRFPFCIPSVVNVVLFGSLLADPAPPVWTFDIGGSSLVVDFSDYGAFAEVSSWTVRLLFTAALLLNTRRFVYGLGGGY